MGGGGVTKLLCRIPLMKSPKTMGVRVGIRGSPSGEDWRNAEVQSSTGGLEADPTAEREACPIYSVPFSHWHTL